MGGGSVCLIAPGEPLGPPPLFLQWLTLSPALSVVLACRLQHHRMCPDGSRSFSGGECSPDQSAERADGETLLSVTDSDSDLDV